MNLKNNGLQLSENEGCQLSKPKKWNKAHKKEEMTKIYVTQL